MRSELTAKLEALRKRLHESDEAWGPESQTDAAYEDGEAGDGGATNVSDAGDALDAYLLGIVDSIISEWDINEDDAIDIVFDVAASLEEDGSLPPMPEAEDAQGSAEWLGKAATMGFAELVLASIEADAEEQE